MPGDQRHADLGAGQSEPCGQDGWEVYFGESVSARFIGGDWAKNHWTPVRSPLWNFAASCTSVHCFCIWSQTILQNPPIPWLCIDSFGDFRRQAWVLQPYFQSRWYRSLGPNRTDSLQFPLAASCPLELWLICSQLAKLKPDFVCSQNQPKSSSRL